MPIGLFFGRIANFVNGELFGRATNVSWGVVFPHGGPEPRHPSQLYEAVLEGFVLFFVLFALSRSKAVRARPGIISGVFLIGYALSRMTVEFREPDVQIGFIFNYFTMGQLLCIPMIIMLIRHWMLKHEQSRPRLKNIIIENGPINRDVYESGDWPLLPYPRPVRDAGDLRTAPEIS